MWGARSAVALLAVAIAALAGCGGSDAPQRYRPQTIYSVVKETCGREPRTEFAANQGFPTDISVVALAHRYVAEWPRGDRQEALAGCKAGMENVPLHFPASASQARDLWGRTFLVTAVRGEDEDPPVVQPISIRVSFSSEHEHGIGWVAGCNSYGGNLQVTATTMNVAGTGSTLVGCEEAVEEQEEWLANFLEADPRWQLDGERLRLSSDGATVELRGFEDPHLCPLSPKGGRIELGNSGFGCEDALQVAGEDRYLAPWKCGDSDLGGGRLRVVCRDGKKWFAVQGLEPPR